MHFSARSEFELSLDSDDDYISPSDATKLLEKVFSTAAEAESRLGFLDNERLLWSVILGHRFVPTGVAYVSVNLICVGQPLRPAREGRGLHACNPFCVVASGNMVELYGHGTVFAKKQNGERKQIQPEAITDELLEGFPGLKPKLQTA